MQLHVVTHKPGWVSYDVLILDRVLGSWINEFAIHWCLQSQTEPESWDGRMPSETEDELCLVEDVWKGYVTECHAYRRSTIVFFLRTGGDFRPTRHNSDIWCSSPENCVSEVRESAVSIVFPWFWARKDIRWTTISIGSDWRCSTSVPFCHCCSTLSLMREIF